MEAHPLASRQLPLALDPTSLAAGPLPVMIPTAIEADLIEALATLLLEAAGVVSSTDAGGVDES